MQPGQLLYRWMFPAIVVLPLWVLLGWGIFGGGGLAFILVAFLACPAIGLAQLVLALLSRIAASAQRRSLSGNATLWMLLWHGLVIAAGFFQPWSWLAFLLAVPVAVLAFTAILLDLRQRLGFASRRTGAADGDGARVYGARTHPDRGGGAPGYRASGPIEIGELTVIDEDEPKR